MLIIFRALWRHKIISLLVGVLTIAGAVYTVALSEPVYEASASYAFFNPPGAPSQSAINRDPSLAEISPDNPYTRFADQSVVVEILARSVNSPPARRALVAAGADKRYTVVPSRRFGSGSPIAEVTGVGTTPERALATMQIVGDALEARLREIQEQEFVNERYLIRAVRVEATDQARLRVSSRLRSLVAVLGLGTFLLFVLVSVADAIRAGTAVRRVERKKRRAGRRSTGLVREDYPRGVVRSESDPEDQDEPPPQPQDEPELDADSAVEREPRKDPDVAQEIGRVERPHTERATRTP